MEVLSLSVKPALTSENWEDQDWVRASVAAEMAKAEGTDDAFLLETMYNFVVKLLPQRVKAESKGLFKKTFVGFTASLDKVKLALRMESGQLVPEKTLVSGGINLKTERIAMDEWNEELIQWLERNSKTDSATRAALKNFVGGV